jgi:hypothetical protein
MSNKQPPQWLLCLVWFGIGVTWGKTLFIENAWNSIFHHGLSACAKCNKTWDVVKPHTLWYEEKIGVFVLCEVCNLEAGIPENKIGYYWRSTLHEAERNPKELDNWPAIKAAVMEGK